MKIVLDTEVCKKMGKDGDVALYLLSLLSGCRITVDTFEKARQQNLLKFDRMYDRRYPFPDYVSLNQTGEYVAESLMASSETSTQSAGRFPDLAKKMMELYPKGYKVTSSGNKYSWRGNATTIADRLEKFVTKYGNYSDEDFLDATRRYLADYAGKPDMRILMYFIYKNVDGEKREVGGRIIGDRDRISPLADYLANKESAPVDFNWDIELR